MEGASGSSDELQPGDRVGAYRIERVLGRGGVGVVYLATRDPDGGRVALKMLREAIARDPTVRRRFEHEARAAGRIRHPHLVPLIEAGEIDGRPFLVSRYMAGGSLEDRLQETGPVTPPSAVTIVEQVGGALDALHAAGIVHRDVKPANVLLESDGGAALGDLGLAKGGGYTALTTVGRFVGTIDYLAPELVRGEPAGPASDRYALACVMYAAIAGHAPFAGSGPIRAAFGHLQEEPADPSAMVRGVPHALGQVIVAALAKDPTQRPASAAAFAASLRAALESNATS